MNRPSQENWIYVGAWPGISLADSLIWQGPDVTRRFHEEFGIWKGCANVFTNRGQTQHLFARTELFENMRKSLNEAMSQDPTRIFNRLSRYYDDAHTFRTSVGRLSSAAAPTLSEVALGELFRFGRSLQQEMAIYDQFGIFSEKFFLEHTNHILERQSSDEENRFRLFSELTAPWTYSTPQREQLAVMRLLGALAKHVDFEEAAAEQQSQACAHVCYCERVEFN